MNEREELEYDVKIAKVRVVTAEQNLVNFYNTRKDVFMPIPEGIKLSSAGIIVNNGRTLMEIDCGLVELTNFKNTDWDDYSDNFQLKKITFGEIVEGDRILACSDKSEYSDLIYWYVIDEGLRAYYYNEGSKTAIYGDEIEEYDELWKVVSKK